MSLAARIGVMLVAVLLTSTGALKAQPHDTLVVAVSTTFDGSVSSGVTKAIARQETTDIWRDYGVEFLWDGSAADAALRLEVIVASAKTEYAPSALSVLGRTELDGTGMAIGPIRINIEAIEELLEHRFSSGVLVHERELGRALGRVLAHEIDHALLGVPSYHDPEGLMRLSIPVDDLVQPDRRCVQLAVVSVNRLRDRVSCLGDHAMNGLCTREIRSVSVKD